MALFLIKIKEGSWINPENITSIYCGSSDYNDKEWIRLNYDHISG